MRPLTLPWRPEQPYNHLPPLPPPAALETRAVLKRCITARSALAELKLAAELIPNQQPYCRIGNVVDKGIAQRQAASRHLKELVALGVLRERQGGQGKTLHYPRLTQRLTRDNNTVPRYA